ncbi:MAG: prohibitin family protein [Halothece sp. Uz-M2-17]|nr:prohibitin family protein [Halothece sp. Uz-M2-17]
MSQYLSKLGSRVGIVGGGIIAGLAIIGIVGANSTYVNDETERAIVTNSGEYVKTTGPGMHWKIPFQESYRQYPVSIEKMKIQEVSTSTVDNYAINATIVLLYRLPEDQLRSIHSNIPDYQEKIEVVATSRFKNELGNIKMDQLADKRAEIEKTVYDSVKSEINRLFNINIVDFTIPYYGWSDAFKQAARREAKAETDLEVARQEAKEAEIKAERKQTEAKAQADAKIEAARGEAEAKRLAAEAEADSIRLKGEAEAEALEAKSQALAQDPQLVELEKAKQWDGKLPTNVYGQAPIPFMQSTNNN